MRFQDLTMEQLLPWLFFHVTMVIFIRRARGFCVNFCGEYDFILKGFYAEISKLGHQAKVSYHINGTDMILLGNPDQAQRTLFCLSRAKTERAAQI